MCVRTIANASKRLYPMIVRQMSTNSVNNHVPSTWQRISAEFYNKAPTIVVTAAVTAIVSGSSYVVYTIENRIGELGDSIKEARREAREDVNKLDRRIDALRKETREAMGKLSDKIDSQTKIMLEMLNKRSWWS